MTSTAKENVLLIGDTERRVESALSQALPGANITSVNSFFEGIAELTAQRYSAVLAAAEPIERRPEAAVKSLRQLAGTGRVVLFGDTTIEPLSRKMLSFGCDDYIVTPVNAAELSQIFGAAPLRLAEGEEAALDSLASSPPTRLSLLMGLPLAEIVLDAILQHPHGGAHAAVDAISQKLGPAMHLSYMKTGETPVPTPDGLISMTHAVRAEADDIATLQLILPRDEDQSTARHLLAQIAHLMGKVASLEDRHVKLQKLAITDDLTGLYNSRYFRHFLTAILNKAHTMRFPVTLLLFDIDGFKTYNDQYGHAVGDDILRQTAALMKKCVRDHDLVARLGGDEFAVVFWEKEGPRTPHGPKPAVSSRVPQTPLQVFDRFRKLIRSPDFSYLGSTGKGTLTISGGLAVYPYDAQDVDGLINEADKAMMFKAKQQGKDTIFLVGEDEPVGPEEPS